MNLHKLIFTENACYKAGKKITVKGIMVHSTGANNPWLKRYVGPDDGKLGKNQYNNHWNTYHPGDREVCVHGFIGKLADGTVATYQTLPWDHRGWHAGGSANNSHIGFEICEDGLSDRTYFEKVYQEAVELCAHLCKEYDLTEKDIICHSEGHKHGIASNHGDVMHWFPKHGKSMDTFRAAVKELLEEPHKEDTTTAPELTQEDRERIIWEFLSDKLGNAYGTAGVMGNLYAESGLRPTNLQNTFEKKLECTDEDYTAAVDSGAYDNFVKDSAGYGLAQWTYWSRKEALLEFAQTQCKSIGDLAMQLDFLWKELSENYSSLLKILQTASSVEVASTAVLTQYERPADMGEAVRAKRAEYGLGYFKKYIQEDYPARLTTGYYRVRQAWDNKRSQIGAYRILANARKTADKNPGTYVFTEDGIAIYPVESLAEPAYRIHVVAKGDTLWGIAKHYLGNGSRYSEIKELNKLKSNTIYSGWKLKIPN